MMETETERRLLELERRVKRIEASLKALARLLANRWPEPKEDAPPDS